MRKLTVLMTIAASLIALAGCAPGGKRIVITASKNPTTLAGRGEPTLDNRRQPCAWIYIDGHQGHFTESEGQPQVQWVIDDPVSSMPTFQVAAYKDLMGAPDVFTSALVSMESEEGGGIGYGISSDDGSFKVGAEYPLLSPGPGFVIRNTETQEPVGEIAPLPPGPYMLTAKIENRDTGAKTLAVTQFTVGQPAPTESSD